MKFSVQCLTLLVLVLIAAARCEGPDAALESGRPKTTSAADEGAEFFGIYRVDLNALRASEQYRHLVQSGTARGQTSARQLLSSAAAARLEIQAGAISLTGDGFRKDLGFRVIEKKDGAWLLEMRGVGEAVDRMRVERLDDRRIRVTWRNADDVGALVYERETPAANLMRKNT